MIIKNRLWALFNTKNQIALDSESRLLIFPTRKLAKLYQRTHSNALLRLARLSDITAELV